ncbi:coiled-coil domain-containing protein 15 isoform X1 [Astatotilapia calliptera]|uniref:Coiled-coil domain containing 15 n=2 Tax=Astatotilapia calliptera TaxID=8154 RepID=A0A3P8Q585_ASTCA|nr:coiled-coil domain-containing protein 15 isoform X1 [Astatotilapia calliptera]
MNANRVIAPKNGRNKAPVGRMKEHRAFRASRVLAERNQAVVAVGAWVEGGQDFVEHPATLALLTDELQAEKRRENEESLQRFQDEVRHRVAQKAHLFKKRQQLQTDPVVTPDMRVIWTHREGETVRTAAQQRVMERRPQESAEGMRQVRLRLAACQVMQQEETTSELPGGSWNISQTKHKAESHALGAEEDALGEEDDVVFTSRHECPLVQQKGSERPLWNPEQSQPDSGFTSSFRIWPLTDQEELKRQRKSQFLMHRRLAMNIEREQVKENKQHRKHLKQTARIKAEKEQMRLEEERRLERVQQLAEAKQKLEERELLILERLKLEEEERAVELQRRKREEKGKVAARFIEALRAQMKERMSQVKLELPPLCCCASSFWDSHPDTCANNCVFYNNPKVYAQALHSALASLDLQ